MQQNVVHSYYPDLRRISYNDGVLTLKPSWPEGSYPYSYNGQQYTSTARDVQIRLLDTAQQRTAADQLATEMNRVAQNLNDIEQRLQSINASMPDTIINKVNKHGRAISVNSAFSALPNVYEPGKNFVGIGLGHFDSHTGVALGISRSFENGFVIQGRYGASEGTSVVSAGAGFSF